MKKKKALITASILACAFAGATHLEWVGYNYFDRENGDNFLCKADPGCRHLTADEVKLARQYFGDSIKYNNAKIFSRPFMYMFGHDRTGMAPNGNIYIPQAENRSKNYAIGDIQLKALFMHEMTHVAQSQSGMNIPKQALLTLLKHAFNYSDAYKYEIDNSYAYHDMNLEQQAQIMQDYFYMRSDFVLMTTLEKGLNDTNHPTRFPTMGPDWLKERCHELKQYEVKLFPAFPIKPDEMCLPPQKDGFKLSRSQSF